MRIAIIALTAVMLLPSAASAARPAKAPSVMLIAERLGVSMDGEIHQLNDEQEHAAHDAGSRLLSLCPDCRLSTIDDPGPCGWARGNRRVIQAAVVKGMSADEIVKAYVDTYGPDIIPVDKDSGWGRASWVVPYLGAGLGLAIVGFVGWRLRRRQSEDASAPEAEEVAPALAPIGDAQAALQQELAELD